MGYPLVKSVRQLQYFSTYLFWLTKTKARILLCWSSLKYCVPGGEVRPNPKNDPKLYLLVKLYFWRYEKCCVLFHCPKYLSGYGRTCSSLIHRSNRSVQKLFAPLLFLDCRLAFFPNNCMTTITSWPQIFALFYGTEFIAWFLKQSSWEMPMESRIFHLPRMSIDLCAALIKQLCARLLHGEMSDAPLRKQLHKNININVKKILFVKSIC